MEELVEGKPAHLDFPIEAACPECGASIRVQMKYNKEFGEFMDFMRTQKEMSAVAGSYTYNGEAVCSCGKPASVSLSVVARDVKRRDKPGEQTPANP